MKMKMGLKVFYAPEGVPAGAADGNDGQQGKPDQDNAAKVTAPAWMAQLPGDLKTNEQLSRYATLGDAIKSLMEGNKQQEEPKQPEKAEPVKYENFAAKFSPEDDPLGDLGTGVTEYLQGKGIPQKDAEDLVTALSGVMATAKESMISKGRELCEKAVRAEWGNDYDSKKALMARGYQALGDTDGSLQKALDACGASLTPAVWELLSRVGQLVSEDQGSPYSGRGSGRSGGVPVDYSKPSE